MLHELLRLGVVDVLVHGVLDGTLDETAALWLGICRLELLLGDVLIEGILAVQVLPPPDIREHCLRVTNLDPKDVHVNLLPVESGHLPIRSWGPRGSHPSDGKLLPFFDLGDSDTHRGPPAHPGPLLRDQKSEDAAVELDNLAIANHSVRIRLVTIVKAVAVGHCCIAQCSWLDHVPHVAHHEVKFVLLLQALPLCAQLRVRVLKLKGVINESLKGDSV